MAVRRYRHDLPKQHPVVDRRGEITLSWSEAMDRFLDAASATDVDGAWNPPSLGSGAATQANIGAPGARPGDFVVPSHDRLPVGMLISGAVTAADQVTVTLINVSGGTIDIPAGTLRVRFWSFDP